MPILYLTPLSVMPAKAGIQSDLVDNWMPAFAGMTPNSSKDCPITPERATISVQMNTQKTHKMTAPEWRAATSLSLVMALRMLGLFMILPVFSLYADQLTGATPTLIGLAMGIYGLTQALFQMPFGAISDYVGRRKIILLGLIFFIVGSIVCAITHTITGMILGRALQGMGAVGSTIMAMIADLTRAEQRSKAMALAGMTIGASFAVAMMTGPLLANAINLFWLAGFLGSLAIVVLYVWVPTPKQEFWHSEAEPALNQFSVIFKDRELMRFNIGIFSLHAILTACFVILPLSLQLHTGLPGPKQWMLYLPTLGLAFIFSLLFIVLAEKYHQVKLYFLAAIIALGVSELFLWFFANNLLLSAASLLLFFTAFSLLEAFLPSLVSRTAPSTRRGTALGTYSCSQFLGIFVGGALGGWLYGKFGLPNVFLFCILLTSLWFVIAFGMKK